MCAFLHIIGIALPANPMSDCGLSPLSTRPCTQDQAAGRCVQLLPGPGRESVAGWQTFAGSPQRALGVLWASLSPLEEMGSQGR